MQKRNIIFVKKSIKALNKIQKEWIPAGSKNKDGLFYACLYCDQNCGKHDHHDDDCLSDKAVQILKKIQEINESNEYDFDYRSKLRPSKVIKSIKNYYIMKLLLTEFYTPFMINFIPLDYEDKENDSIICKCNFASNVDTLKHTKDCYYNNFAQILSDFYKILP